MKNIKNIKNWIDQCHIDRAQKDAFWKFPENAPSIDDLLEILNISTLVSDDDDEPVPSQCQDREHYEPYLDSSREKVVMSYLFSIYESLDKTKQEKISTEINKRVQWNIPVHYYCVFLLGGDRAEVYFTDIEPLSPKFIAFKEAKIYYDANKPNWKITTNHEYGDYPYIFLIENEMLFFTNDAGEKKNSVIMSINGQAGFVKINNTGDLFSWQAVTDGF